MPDTESKKNLKIQKTIY